MSRVDEFLSRLGFPRHQKMSGYTEAEVVCFLWHIAVDYLDRILQSGLRRDLISIRSDHWVHELVEKVGPLLTPYLASCGITNVLQPLPDANLCGEFAADICTLHLSVLVSPYSLSDLLAFLIPHNFPPTRFIALSFLQCPSLHTVIGNVLFQSLQAENNSKWFGFALNGSLDVLQSLKEEMLATRAELHTLRQRDRESVLAKLPCKRSRTSASIAQTIDAETSQLQFALKCKSAFKHMPQTLAEAANMFTVAGYMSPGDSAAALDDIVGDNCLSKHILIVDQALDRALAEEIERERGHTFFGVGMATDESPPSGRRFCSFRFQVTQIYIPFIPDSDSWNQPKWEHKPPLNLKQRLLDIVHCPHKDGASTSKALQKQMQSIGLTLHDIHGGTGDGGGEMEGAAGVHKVLEHENPTYVRRRCLGHLSWRAVDAAITTMECHDSAQAILKYLRETGTWLRLQAIATQPAHSGGLAHTTEGSRLFGSMFSVSPPSIVDGRPE